MKPKIIQFSEGFSERLNDLAEKNGFSFEGLSAKKIGRRISSEFKVWKKERPGVKMDVKITKATLLELENKLIAFFQ